MNHPILSIGFRPFFLLAGLWSAIAVVLWVSALTGKVGLPTSELLSLHWHAHEMIYGYSMAVVAGFLLTAVRNWTGRSTLVGGPLLACALLWVGARSTLFMGKIELAAFFDLAFMGLLFGAVARPILQSGQKRQYPILGKLAILFGFNALFYAGAMGWFDQGIRLGIYGGFFLIIGLIIMMAGRVVPFFIHAADRTQPQAPTYTAEAIVGMLLFLGLYITELTQMGVWFNALASGLLALLIGARLIRWYQPVVRKQPLLWVLYSALIWLMIGLIMKALSAWHLVSPLLALHALAYGGIGLITFGMMTRVSIGHTGRALYASRPLSTCLFIILNIGAVVRVLLPIGWPEHYLMWLSVSETLWAIAFVGFTVQVGPMLIKPRM